MIDSAGSPSAVVDAEGAAKHRRVPCRVNGLPVVYNCRVSLSSPQERQKQNDESHRAPPPSRKVEAGNEPGLLIRYLRGMIAQSVSSIDSKVRLKKVGDGRINRGSVRSSQAHPWPSPGLGATHSGSQIYAFEHGLCRLGHGVTDGIGLEPCVDCSRGYGLVSQALADEWK